MFPFLLSLFIQCSSYIKFEKGGDCFWLGPRTFAQVVSGDDESQIFAYDVNPDSVNANSDHEEKPFTAPVLVGAIPSDSAANFRYNVDTRTLVFSAYVYPDGNLSTVKEKDKQWEGRGNSAYVYDTTYVRHWDVWQGNKGPQLFSINLSQDENGAWKLRDNVFNSPLKGTKHVCIFTHFNDLCTYMISQYSPVAPFGGTDDFDVSATHIVYTTKDTKLPEAWHTKQNVCCIYSRVFHCINSLQLARSISFLSVQTKSPKN